jgi:DNA-binding response OmpR family regulator
MNTKPDANAAFASGPSADTDMMSDRVLIRRGPVSLAFDPIEIWYRSEPILLSPTEGALFAMLMSRGRASWPAIDQMLSERACSASFRDALIYRIRRKFHAAGAQDPIQTVRGWGLKLRVEGEPDRPHRLVIGERTSTL